MDRRTFLTSAAKAVAAVGAVSYFDIGAAYANSDYIYDPVALNRQLGVSMRFIRRFEIVGTQKLQRYDALYGWGAIADEAGYQKLKDESVVAMPTGSGLHLLAEHSLVEKQERMNRIANMCAEHCDPTAISPENLDEMVKRFSDEIDRRGLEEYEKLQALEREWDTT